MLICFFAFFGNGIYAQTSKTDSIKKVLNTQTEDNSRVDALNRLSSLVYSSNPDTSLELARQALDLAEKLNYAKGIANAYNNLGIGHYVKGNYKMAVDFNFKALEYYENTKSIPLAERKLGQGDAYNNIGNIYYRQGNAKMALENYSKALAIWFETGNKKGIASSSNNIGNIHAGNGEFDKAIEFYFKAADINSQTGNTGWQSNNLMNVGEIYFMKNDYVHSEEYYQKSLQLKEQIHDRSGMAMLLVNMSNLSLKSGKLQESKNRALKGLELARQVSAKPQMRDALLQLSLSDSVAGDYKSAYNYHKLYASYKDSVINDVTNQAIFKKQLQHDYEKKEAIAKADQEKKLAIAETEKKQQRLVLLLVSFVLILVIVFALFIARTLRTTRSQKIIIEMKQKEILDSIHYAKKIQQSLLPTEKYIRKIMDRAQTRTS